MRSLFATAQFKKDLKKIAPDIIENTENIIKVLRDDPLAARFNIKKLTGITPSVWRVRIGVYRLVYSYDKSSLTLHRFRHRKDIYRNL